MACWKRVTSVALSLACERRLWTTTSSPLGGRPVKGQDVHMRTCHIDRCFSHLFFLLSHFLYKILLSYLNGDCRQMLFVTACVFLRSLLVNLKLLPSEFYLTRVWRHPETFWMVCAWLRVTTGGGEKQMFKESCICLHLLVFLHHKEEYNSRRRWYHPWLLVQLYCPFPQLTMLEYSWCGWC